MEQFKSLGYTVKINDPFAGSLVPMTHYGSNPNVLSLMIEVNRDIYKQNFEQTKLNISRVLNRLALYFEQFEK